MLKIYHISGKKKSKVASSDNINLNYKF